MNTATIAMVAPDIFQVSKITHLLRTAHHAREAGKAAYKLADALVADAIASGLTPDQQVVVEDGLILQLVDNFANGNNTVFRPAAVHRFELHQVAE